MLLHKVFSVAAALPAPAAGHGITLQLQGSGTFRTAQVLAAPAARSCLNIDSTHRQEGRRKGDRNIGRYLADTVDAVPQLGQEELEKLCRDNTQVLSCSPLL
jgi:hypothetical protein